MEQQNSLDQNTKTHKPRRAGRRGLLHLLHGQRHGLWQRRCRHLTGKPRSRAGGLGTENGLDPQAPSSQETRELRVRVGLFTTVCLKVATFPPSPVAQTRVCHCVAPPSILQLEISHLQMLPISSTPRFLERRRPSGPKCPDFRVAQWFACSENWRESQHADVRLLEAIRRHIQLYLMQA